MNTGPTPRKPPPNAHQLRNSGGLHGTYVSVEPFHLFRYLDERLFSYNLRDLDDYGRFATVLRAVAGRRLTYAELIGQR